VAGKRQPSKGLARAIEKSTEFFGFLPRWVRRKKITWSGQLIQIGGCVRVDYVNDKYDSKVRRYFHEFENQAQIFADPVPQKNGEMVLVIVGRFKIEAEGIIG